MLGDIYYCHCDGSYCKYCVRSYRKFADIVVNTKYYQDQQKRYQIAKRKGVDDDEVANYRFKKPRHADPRNATRRFLVPKRKLADDVDLVSQGIKKVRVSLQN